MEGFMQNKWTKTLSTSKIDASETNSIGIITKNQRKVEEGERLFALRLHIFR